MKKLIALLLLLAVACANVYLISPVQKTVDEIDRGDYIEHINYLPNTHLGKIAPGQKLDLTFLRKADDNFNWHQLEFLETDYVGPINIDENQMTVAIEIPPEELKGRKQITLKFRNDLNLRTPEIITFTFDVAHDLYRFTVPSGLQVHAGKSQTVKFILESDSISTDELILGDFEGLPAQWSRSGTIQIKPGERKELDFDITAMDEGWYNSKFQLSSTSGAVLGTQKVTLQVLPTLKSKFKIYGEGFAFIPAVLQPFYSLLSWFGI